MAGTMSRADLVADLKASLMDAAKAFTAAADADFKRHLDVAAADMHRVRPHTLIGEIVLTAGESVYSAPADCAFFKSALWGAGYRVPPWDKAYVGLLPRTRLVGDQLVMTPAPTVAQVAALGAGFRFFYVMRDVIGDEEADTTVLARDRSWLILRAQVEAMSELAMRDAVRPARINDGFSGQAKTGTPAGLRDSLMTIWLEGALK